jgi:flagellar biosynthesis/type III secretory pathway M-ring protein FliF/YscJ
MQFPWKRNIFISESHPILRKLIFPEREPLVKLHTIKFDQSFEMTDKKPQRAYPPFYEIFVPVAIGILAIVVIGMLAFTIAIGVGAL